MAPQPRGEQSFNEAAPKPLLASMPAFAPFAAQAAPVPHEPRHAPTGEEEEEEEEARGKAKYNQAGAAPRFLPQAWGSLVLPCSPRRFSLGPPSSTTPARGSKGLRGYGTFTGPNTGDFVVLAFKKKKKPKISLIMKYLFQ